MVEGKEKDSLCYIRGLWVLDAIPWKLLTLTLIGMGHPLWSNTWLISKIRWSKVLPNILRKGWLSEYLRVIWLPHLRSIHRIYKRRRSVPNLQRSSYSEISILLRSIGGIVLNVCGLSLGCILLMTAKIWHSCRLDFTLFEVLLPWANLSRSTITASHPT